MANAWVLGAALSSIALLGGCVVDGASDTSSGTGGDGGDAAGGSPTSGSGGAGATGAGAGGSGASGGAGGGGADSTGLVFTMTNAEDTNEVIVFERDETGALIERETVPAGGEGTGGGLGSQGALALSPDGELLFVVNAGSNQISSFRIYDDHLALMDVVDSGGERPISLTANDDYVYVVNADGDGGVVGFSEDGGMLTPIEGAARGLSQAGGAGPGQIMLSPDGSALIVTEKATNSLLTYWIAPDGSLSEATITASEGMTPFGFDFADDSTLVVSEAFGGNDGESAASSYTLGSVEPESISSSVPSGQSAACWLLVAQGKFAYTTNTASDNVSGYELSDNGALTLFDDDGETAMTGTESGPIDMALSADHQFLYVLNGGTDEIMGYAIEDDGSLTPQGDWEVPETSVGLIGR